MVVEIGNKAPEICLPDTDRKIRMLSEFKGKKVVLAFFPGAFYQRLHEGDVLI